MPTFSKLQSQPSIQPHQVYEYVGKKPDKRGWQVQITSASPTYVQAMPYHKDNPSYLPTVIRNGGYSYRRDAFERDWRLVLVNHTTNANSPGLSSDALSILDAITEPTIIDLNHTDTDTDTELDGTHDMLITPSEPTSDAPDAPDVSDVPDLHFYANNKVCKTCNQDKLLSAYRVHNKTGKPLDTCNQCIEKKRQATRVAIATNKANTGVPSDNKPTLTPPSARLKPIVYTPPTTNDTPQAIADDLLKLATRLEALDNPTYLLKLVIAVRDYILETEEAHGVALTPMLRFQDLQAAYTLVKDKVEWPSTD